ncbi:MAG: GldG family protein [Candidatus Krumholzibacteria bacterium]|nr:GldG family protein [Candidatus Krumholzibacteria bacterium]
MNSRAPRILGAVGLALVTAGGILYGILYTRGWTALLPLLAGLAMTVCALVIAYRTSATEGARRSARHGLSAGFSVIVLAAILVFLQTLAHRHNVRVDLTRNSRFSLAAQTIKVLDGLRMDVRITAFYKETTPERTEMQDLLSELQNRTPRVEFLFVDPDQDPVTARRFGAASAGLVFVEAGSLREELADPSEEMLTNAIARITTGKRRSVCFLTGHGEKSIGDAGSLGLSALGEALELENFEVRELLAIGEESIPSDCDVIVLAGPERDIVMREQNLLLDYLTSGGRALMLLDPMTDLANIEGVIAAFGLGLGDDVLVDRYGKLLAGNFLTPVVNRYGTHPITEGFRHFSFFPQARSVAVLSPAPADVAVTVICSTNEGAYAETDLPRLLEGETQYEPSADAMGPIDVAAAAEMTLSGNGDAARRSRIVVFGDSDFAGNSNLRLSGNRDLILNTVNWLAEAEDLISIRPANDLLQPVLLSVTQGGFVFWIPVVALPALVAAIGAAVLARKRRSG